ncbi:nicotinamide riboside transporter PnuC [Marinobacter zhejiangensis]|uniref:Nicotinamide riboside transporter PnuC n=1 Tax=Marinobacter zhejiangensis TaxID=488535 RepID=A0A1I4Q349_9GAMM|nr:nicotinamide riboside transporter PnuC [Marinobacter zhejiangensis]SFM34499.1 nicotinamide mononucleotide transporter [Marinobacter zhejiangensis]
MDFLVQMVGSRPIEMVAVACGLLNVLLIIRRSMWNYPFGFLMVVLYAKIFYDYQLYSDALLQVYFFFIQIYGVWCWLQGQGDDGRIRVRYLPRQHYAAYLLLTLAGWLALSSLMSHFTDAAYPYWDGAIAALSVLAQFLMSRRHVESWYLWITVDVLAIGLFAARDLTPTAALYGVFLVLAVLGMVQWQRASRRAAVAEVA